MPGLLTEVLLAVTSNGNIDWEFIIVGDEKMNCFSRKTLSTAKTY